ncbi:MAG: FAD-binding oxidoreductase [Chloroflexi bacterium]|nr:FAD-binding oxidoreductase [Chloroflexota bacterium]
MSRKVFSPGQTLRQELEQILGTEDLLTEVQELTGYEVEGLVPAMACFPRSSQQVAEILMSANSHRSPVVPWGHGSKQHLGLPLKASGLLLSLARVSGPLEVEAANMTVRARAGMGLKQLSQHLERHGLFLPLDPPDADSATLGGCLAANSSGPRRLGYGTLRDMVLGVTVVLPTGQMIHSGGSTMKDVAGYSLRRMFIGSWGTLGIMTEATLRLLPLPESRCTLAIRSNDCGSLLQVMARIRASSWLPAAAELIGPGTGHEGVLGLKPGQWLLLLQLEAMSEVVQRQSRETTAAATDSGIADITRLQGQEMESIWQSYRRWWQRLETQPSAVRLKVSLLFTRQDEWLHQASDICLETGLAMRLVAHIGDGILYPHLLPGNPAQEETLQPAVEQLGQLTTRLGGFQMVEVAPRWLRKRVQLLPHRGDYPLMKKLKASLDPDNLLNPGRVLGASASE